MQKAKPVERVTKIATIKQTTKNFGPYLGPKSYNGQRSGSSITSSATSSSSKTSASGYTKSAPKVVVHATHKPSKYFFLWASLQKNSRIKKCIFNLSWDAYTASDVSGYASYYEDA